MKILHAKKPIRLLFVLLFCLLGYHTIASAQIAAKPIEVFTEVPIQTKKHFYFSGPLYDGANTIGRFWPQLWWSDASPHRLWTDLGIFGTFGVGAGYRYLLKPALFQHHLCFAGAYAYLEWPHWELNPIVGIPLVLLGENFGEEMYAILKYGSRFNVGFEGSIPYCKLTINGYGSLTIDPKMQHNIRLPLRDYYGISLRLSTHTRNNQIKPFFEIAKNWVTQVNIMQLYLAKNNQDGTRIVWALGVRTPLTKTVDCEIKAIHDLGQSWGFGQHHFPIHVGLHYTPSISSHDISRGYAQLPERFIPHYANNFISNNILNDR